MKNQRRRPVGARAHLALLTFIFAPALALVAGCDGDKKPDASDGPAAATKPQADAKSPEGDTPKAKPEKKPSRREALESYRPLMDELTRAELRVGGLHVDFGTLDAQKYTRAGWKNSWGTSKVEGETTAQSINARKVVASITTLASDGPVKEMVLRLKSGCKGGKVDMRIDGKSAGTGDFGADYTVARVPVPDEMQKLATGQHDITFLFDSKCRATPRAMIDWMWLATEQGAEPPAIVERRQSINIGESTRRALAAPTARTYSYYLQVPEKAELVFDYASPKADQTFVVRATTDDGAPKELFNAKSEATWREGVVPLGGYAGKVVRLDLEVQGGEGGGFGEVDLMVEPREKPEIAAGPRQAKNVVVVLIDTVRGDVYRPFGGEGSKVKTPGFDKLSKEATVFANAYDMENWTKPSVASVLSGLYPATHQAKTQDAVLSSEIELITQRLQKNGFKTGGFIANGYISDKFGFKKGWNKYINYIREGKSTKAKNLYTDALEFVEGVGDDRFFVYIHTIDPHVPYRTHGEVTEQYYDGEYSGPVSKTIFHGETQAKYSGDHTTYKPKDYDWIRAMYYGEVTYHDEQMGVFFDALREKGILDDTLVIVTNDHGEELDDHGKMGHGHTLYDELIHGPLLVRFPSRVPAGVVVEDPVELVDISPTVLELADVEPSKEHEGLSLVPLIEGRNVARPYYTFSEFLDNQRAIRVGDWKLIGSAASWSKLFNISTDPGEQKNVVKEAPLARRMCEIHVTEALGNVDKRTRTIATRVGRKYKAGKVEMDPELKKQLEALGYFHDE